MKRFDLKNLYKILRDQRLERESQGRQRSKTWSKKKTAKQERKEFNAKRNKDG